MHGIICDPGMSSYPLRVVLALRTIARGSIHTGDARFRPRFVVIVDVRNDFLSGDWTLVACETRLTEKGIHTSRTEPVYGKLNTLDSSFPSPQSFLFYQ